MQTQSHIRPGQWIDERNLLVSVYGGEITVITLTEPTDTTERAEREALRLQARRVQARFKAALRESCGRLS